MQETRRRGSKSERNKLTVDYLAESTTSEDYQIIADYLNKQEGSNPLTADDIKERMKYFAHYTSLVKDGDQVIGLGDCYVSRLENFVYGENLLIAPAYQGFIYGGSFLFTILDAVQTFFKKEAGVSPHKMISSVQAGNLRAGKLYERLGYFDMDAYGNRIQNFIPFIYDYPFAKRFFQTQEVELVHCWKYYNPAYEEVLTQKKIKTFPYAFKTKTGFLRVILDGISEHPLWVEDDRVLIASWIEEQEVYVGIEKEIHWLLENRMEIPAEFHLYMYGNGGLNFDFRETYVLMPGERKQLTKSLKACFVDDAELNTIQTEVVFGDEVVRLKNGYRLKEVIFSKFERDLTKPLRIEQHYRRYLNLFNNYSQPIQGIGRICQVEGIELTGEREFSFTIAAREMEKIAFDFQTLTSGVGRIQIQLNLTTTKPEQDLLIVVNKEIDLELGVLELDGLLTWKAENNLTIVENENYALIMPNPNLDRNLYLLDKARNERVLKIPEEELGPKFIPEFVHETRPQFSIISHRIIEKEGCIILQTEMEYRLHKNLFLLREYSMSRSNMISINYRLLNRSEDEICIGIMSKFKNGWQGANVTLPLEKGMVFQKINGADYPGTAYDVKFAENWTAMEYDDKVLGIVWGSGRISYRKFNNLPQIDSGTYRLQPGTEVQVPTMYIYYGGGTAEEVRNLYRAIGSEKQVELTKREVLDLNIDHRQLIMNQRRASFDLAVERVLDFIESRWIVGNLNVRGPEGWKIEVVDQKMVLELPADIQSGLYPLMIEYAAPTLHKIWPIQIFVTDLEEDSEITVQNEGDLIRVENGYISYTVSPAFRDRVVSLVFEDQEYLCTTYPEASAYHKEAPWFGGIGFFSSVNQWKRHAEYPVERQVDGSLWKGIGFAYNSPQNPGVEIEMEYLTTPGLPMIVVHGKVINRSAKLFTEQITLECNLTNLQKSEEISGFIVENGKQVQYRCKPEKEKYYEILTTGWAAVETGNGNLMIAVNPEKNHQLGIKNWGAFGVHLAVHQSVSLLEGCEKEFTSFFILQKDLETAHQFSYLKPFVMRGECSYVREV